MRVSRLRVAGAGVLVAALGLTGALAPATATADPADVTVARLGVVGSDSGGDPYFPLDGNGGYDVRHYDVRDTYRPGSDRLRGRTRLRAEALVDLRAFHLDLALTPDAVRVDGRPARFRKTDAHELRVTPEQVLRAGAVFRVVVRYHGRPASTRAAGVSPFSHVRGEGLAVGEPQIGPWWFAANETPTDKATFDIAVRVPRGQQAVSNGRLVSRVRTGRWTTWRWRMPEPMVTYLAFFAAGRFDLHRDVVADRVYRYAVSQQLSPLQRKRSAALLRRTPDVLGWLEEQLGAYPFTHAGGVVTGIGLGFALENQGRPVYPYVGGPGTRNVSLVVHEQAHQWFGNDVALTRWRDLWLNEGFATFMEWWYAADHGGRSIDAQLRREHADWPGASSFWKVPISDPGPDRMWSWPVYVRGAMTLAALRNRLGASTFERVLATWLERNRGGHGTGTQFRALAEEVSGEDLDAFFSAWLDATRRPAATAENGLP